MVVILNTTKKIYINFSLDNNGEVENFRLMVEGDKVEPEEGYLENLVMRLNLSIPDFKISGYQTNVEMWYDGEGITDIRYESLNSLNSHDVENITITNLDFVVYG